ncbi:heme/hemin ABC transporter substrate-binding protein [Thalassolituus alkanivorans]|uniref:heme/hemin ABC transporter substrate-binding protein n=1 Tax=Thalassolituus alkanivorans TaxID=2881055 RepID=UPI001E53256D|nr:ABC transporter substrate-binding protein [Thalassolituus alkanivorans]MCB2388137.1 ABC transporter substrate-binding protein [Thalassolituus alkanivorans]MCB2424676.1 ABC transporter substrate-binding protein [Thalassolituus alkanivorans]
MRYFIQIRRIAVFSAGLFSFALFSSIVLSAERVVSIDGSLTEIIYALNAQDALVAVDTTSRYPQAATELPDVGYMRQLSAEGILALSPTLVLASTDAGPDSVFEQLQQAGVKIVRVRNHYSVDGVLNKIQAVADALNKPDAGRALAGSIKQQADAALASIPADAAAPAALFILGAGNRGLMAAGSKTQADAMLALLNARNVMAYNGYKPVSAEAVLQAGPEVVLIANTEAAADTSQAQSAALNTQLAMTPAFRQQRIHTLDTSLVLGFGPRIGSALEQLVTLLYPPEMQTLSSAEQP